MQRKMVRSQTERNEADPCGVAARDSKDMARFLKLLRDHADQFHWFVSEFRDVVGVEASVVVGGQMLKPRPPKEIYNVITGVYLSLVGERVTTRETHRVADEMEIGKVSWGIIEATDTRQHSLLGRRIRDVLMKSARQVDIRPWGEFTAVTEKAKG